MPPERPQSAEEKTAIHRRTTEIAPFLAAAIPFHPLAPVEVQRVSERSLLILTRHWDVAWMLHPTFVDALAILGTLWGAFVRRGERPALAGQPMPAQRPAAPGPPPAAARSPQPAPAPSRSSPAEAAAAYEAAGMIQNGHYVPPDGSPEDTMDQFLQVLREVEPDAPAARHSRA